MQESKDIEVKGEIVSATPKKRTINLIVQYYDAPTPERQKEVDTCLENNCKVQVVDRIYLLNEKKYDLEERHLAHPKITQIVIGERLTFDIGFRFAALNLSGEICVIANADIILTETFSVLHQKNLDDALVALARWNIEKDSKVTINGNTTGSQDTWIFTPPLPKLYPNGYLTPSPILLQDAAVGSIPVGNAWGCENRLAYYIQSAGMKLYNPCYNLITLHLHLHDLQRVRGTRYIPQPFAFIQVRPIDEIPNRK